MQLHRSGQDITEIGTFSWDSGNYDADEIGLSAIHASQTRIRQIRKGLRTNVRQSETVFCFATTIPEQKSAIRALRLEGFRPVAKKQNPAHNESTNHIITLWLKRVRDKSTKEPPSPYYDWNLGLLERSMYCCGLDIGSHITVNKGKYSYLTLLEQPKETKLSKTWRKIASCETSDLFVNKS